MKINQNVFNSGNPILNISSKVFIALLVGWNNWLCAQCVDYNHAKPLRRYDQLLKPNGKQGEVVQVRFLSKLRSKRDIHKNDYHIFEIGRSSNLSSVMTIHVTKNEDLLSPNFTFKVNNGVGNADAEAQRDPSLQSFADKREGNGEFQITRRNEVQSHCIYSGFLSGAGNVQNSAHVALSACGEHHGFTGLITTNEGTYLLEPVHMQPEGDIALFNGPLPDEVPVPTSQLPHTLTLLSENEAHPSACGGVIYAEDFDKVATSVDGISPSAPGKNANNYYKGSSVSSAGKKSKSSSFAHSGHSPTASVIPMAMMGGNKLKTPTKAYKSGSKSSANRILELAVFVDQSFVEHHKKKLKTNSSKVLKNFILLMVQTMAFWFHLPSLDAKIDIVVVHIELLTKDPASLNSNHGLYIPFLTSFCKYAEKLNADLSKWDHATLFTALDLRSETTNEVLGVAFTGGLCSRSSCSLIETKYWQAPSVIAHELGHSFGIKHDGDSPNLACSPTEHIMARVANLKQTTWSTCSNKNMKDFISKLESRRSWNVKQDCFQTAEENLTKYSFGSKLPGEKFKADDQCFMYSSEYSNAVTASIASRFSFPDKGPYNICKKLYCTTKTNKYCFFIHAALEGTECGPGKWCRDWECVKKP